MRLNRQDYRLLIKLKKEKLNGILKNMESFQFTPFLNFLINRNLFSQLPMSDSEFFMYDSSFARDWINDYLTDNFNENDKNVYNNYEKFGYKGFNLPDKETIEKLYNHFLDIYTNRDVASLYRVIGIFLSNTKEIPEELIKKYLKRSDPYSNIHVSLLQDFIENKIEPPEEVIEAAVKDDIEFNRTRGSTEEILNDLIDQYNDSSMKYSEENEMAKHTLKMYRFIKSELESQKITATESFKSFFNR